MKKYFLIAALFAACFAFMPKTAKAQVYNPYPAMIDTTLSNRVNTLGVRKAMKRKAAAAAKRRRAVKRRAHRRTARRVSALENMITPKSKIVGVSI